MASQDYIDHLKSQQQQEQAFENPDDIYVQDVHENQVNPFNDYGNPDSFIRAQEQQSQLPQPQQPISQQDKQRPQSQQQQATKAPLPQAFPTRRRRKITCLMILVVHRLERSILTKIICYITQIYLQAIL